MAHQDLYLIVLHHLHELSGSLKTVFRRLLEYRLHLGQDFLLRVETLNGTVFANKITLHVNGGYRYATTRPLVKSDGGGSHNKSIHWGTVTDDLRFIPGKHYLYSSLEERGRLIFSEGWDLSEIDKLASVRGKGRPANDGDAVNRFYGDIWLLERIAEKTGLKQDLVSVFDGNLEIVNDVLTQSITECHRMDLFSLRSRRVSKHAYCAVDSTTRSAYGDSLADIKWGKNKEGVPLPQTLEVVVYTIDDRMPLYYRTFQGNIPDAGFGGDLAYITDRGYESLKNIEQYILSDRKVLMSINVGIKLVKSRIRAFGNSGARPSQMVSNRQRNWSEEGKTGRLFILFVSMILGSYLSHIWKSSKMLKEEFQSSLEILDEMRSIRYIEHKGKANKITPFVGDQLKIAEAFGFTISEGCAPGYESRQPAKKRGRPKKCQQK